MRHVLVLAGALAFGSACSDTSPSSGGLDLSPLPDLAVAANADLTPSPDLAWSRPAGYPAPPYGFTAGQVVPNLIFHGYFAPNQTSGLASSQPFGDVSFDQARTSGHRYMMVMFAGFT